MIIYVIRYHLHKFRIYTIEENSHVDLAIFPCNFDLKIPADFIGSCNYINATLKADNLYSYNTFI